MPKEKAHFLLASDRLRFIRDNSDRFLVPWHRIFDLEYENLSDKKASIFVGRERLFGDFGNVIKREEIHRQLIEAVQRGIAGAGNRKLRRELKARLIARGKPSAFLEGYLDQIRREQFEKVSEYPAVQPLLESLFAVISGKATEKEVNETFLKVLTDPVGLCSVSMYAEIDDVFNFKSMLWGQSDELQARIQKIVVQMIEILRKFGMENFREMKKMFVERFYSIETACDVIGRLVARQVTPDQLEEMPASKTFFRQIVLLTEQKIDAHADPKLPSFGYDVSLKRGDFTDLTHTCYASYVDVFCCDKSTRARMERLDFPGTICTSEADILKLMGEG